MAQAVIMAGGPGERFWPLTHKKFPKYRICLDNNRSLLQKTYDRLLKVYPRDHIHVVTTRDHVSMIQEELRGLKSCNLIAEPFRKNTAAAIFLSCEMLGKKYGTEEVVSFFPADHLIKNEFLFKQTIRRAIKLAQKENWLVMIGIVPTFPATGYGYIEAGAALSGNLSAFRVQRFAEKPPRETALGYIKKNSFFWNGGIFTWRIKPFMEAMKRCSPEYPDNFDENDLVKSYKRFPKMSIDYALLEKTKQLAMIKTAMDWCDMGSWDMFLEKAVRDPQNNLIQGLNHHHRSRNSLLVNYDKRPLIAWGVSDLIVVQTPRGTLVCKRGFSEEAALLLKGK